MKKTFETTTHMRIGNNMNKIIVATFAVVLLGCRAGGNDPGLEYAPNMYHAVPYEPLAQIKDKDAGNWVSSLEDGKGEYYSSNPYNPYEMNMRMPPANSVPRTAGGYLPYRIPKDSLEYAARTLKSPLDSTAAITEEGKLLYVRFCQHCHGENGQGDGPVGVALAGVPAYNSALVKDKPEGHIFHVITLGKGRMGAHASIVSPEERWKIVRYVEQLQKK